jgi:hypothetical protein
MSKSVGLLLAIAAVLGLIVAFNPEARANAVEAWEQVKVAWSGFSEQFKDSMGALQGESVPESGVAQHDSDAGGIAALLRDVWLNVSASLSLR